MTPTPTKAGLVERLRDADQNSQQRIMGSRIFCEAADLIESQAAEIARLREALRGCYAATNARAVRGRDHVPSMREEQKAMLEALKALAAAGLEIKETPDGE
ncbi:MULTISPECIES: hypothetical protein [unclassified Novosphingobium]|uniref:hypothetical protein n=1 Tax=unclassified Novosphingobium TaxID=2644732 RepID=UPI001359C470|nr:MULTISPECIES: hypothetical protein [unclassified Novosphingobium]